MTTLVKEEKNVGYDGVFQITHYIYDKEGETDRGCKVSYFNKLKKQYIYISGGLLTRNFYRAIKKISPLIYFQSWVGSWA